MLFQINYDNKINFVDSTRMKRLKPLIDADVSFNPTMPNDLKKLLATNEIAKENFEKFPPSTTKMFLRWVERAKRPETRTKRLNTVFQKAKNNDKNF